MSKRSIYSTGHLRHATVSWTEDSFHLTWFHLEDSSKPGPPHTGKTLAQILLQLPLVVLLVSGLWNHNLITRSWIEGAILFKSLQTSHAISFIILIWSGFTLFTSNNICKEEE